MINSEKWNKGMSTPLAFAHYVLGVELTGVQQMALSYMYQNGSTMLRGGRGCGKTLLLAIYVLWYFYKYGKVVSLFHTERSVRSVLRTQMNLLCDVAHLPRVDEFRDADRRYIERRFNSVRDLRGFSASKLLIIIDECYRISEDFITCLEGLRVSCDLTILASSYDKQIISAWLPEYWMTYGGSPYERMDM